MERRQRGERGAREHAHQGRQGAGEPRVHAFLSWSLRRKCFNAYLHFTAKEPLVGAGRGLGSGLGGPGPRHCCHSLHWHSLQGHEALHQSSCSWTWSASRLCGLHCGSYVDEGEIPQALLPGERCLQRSPSPLVFVPLGRRPLVRARTLLFPALDARRLAFMAQSVLCLGMASLVGLAV